MTTLLENYVVSHPYVTLSHTEYGHHFYLGCGVNILSSPCQRVQTFVENEGSLYRFIIVRQLMSFKVVEDAVCRCDFISILYSSTLFWCYFGFSLGYFFRWTSVSFKPQQYLPRCTAVSSCRYKESKRRMAWTRMCTLRFFILGFPSFPFFFWLIHHAACTMANIKRSVDF